MVFVVIWVVDFSGSKKCQPLKIFLVDFSSDGWWGRVQEVA